MGHDFAVDDKQWLHLLKHLEMFHPGSPEYRDKLQHYYERVDERRVEMRFETRKMHMEDFSPAHVEEIEMGRLRRVSENCEGIWWGSNNKSEDIRV